MKTYPWNRPSRWVLRLMELGGDPYVIAKFMEQELAKDPTAFDDMLTAEERLQKDFRAIGRSVQMQLNAVKEAFGLVSRAVQPMFEVFKGMGETDVR